MTKLLAQAIEAIRTLPNERQDEAAALLLDLVQDDPGSVRLGPRQGAEVERRLREPGPYVTNERVRDLFRRRVGLVRSPNRVRLWFPVCPTWSCTSTARTAST